MRRSLISLATLVIALCVASITLADSAHPIEVQNASQISLTINRITSGTTNLVIGGEIHRNRFASRRPLRGRVVAEVIDDSGEVMSRTSVLTLPRFVGRGLRGGAFELALDQPLPRGTHVVLSFQR